MGVCVNSAADPCSATHCLHFSSVWQSNSDTCQSGQTAKTYLFYHYQHCCICNGCLQAPSIHY